MLNTFLNYNIIATDLGKAIRHISTDPMVKRDTAYYLANIGRIKNVDDLLRNDKLYSYVMKAFGLSEMTYAKGLIRKVLQQGVSNTSALANRLADPRYKALATAFNFSKYGDLTTTFSATKDGTVANYNRQTLEEHAGQQNEGVRLALYFQRKAATITDEYGILADAALLKVVQTAYNIAPSAASIEAQARQIGGKLKIASLKDPAKLNIMLQRFTAMYDITNNPAAPTIDLTGQSVQQGIGLDLVMGLQALRTGR